MNVRCSYKTIEDFVAENKANVQSQSHNMHVHVIIYLHVCTMYIHFDITILLSISSHRNWKSKINIGQNSIFNSLCADIKIISQSFSNSPNTISRFTFSRLSFNLMCNVQCTNKCNYLVCNYKNNHTPGYKICCNTRICRTFEGLSTCKCSSILSHHTCYIMSHPTCYLAIVFANENWFRALTIGN